MKVISEDDVSLNLREDQTLEIYVNGLLAATVTDGRSDFDFAQEILEGMDYIVRKDVYEIRPMVSAEDKYTFRQHSQLALQTGLIGYLRADMDTDGNGFFSSWTDYRPEIKSAEFKAEFDYIINSLREEGDILHNRKALANYCYSTPQSKMQTEQDYYGVRVDTEKYTCLFRLNPNKGDYNVYCYCYVREWLDGHIRAAAKGIRFIDTKYNDKFILPDGGRIVIRYSWGEQITRVCRYVDDYHVIVGENLYHICEFAEKLEVNGHRCEPVRDTLPERCYSILDSTGEIIVVKRNESGYYRVDIPAKDAKEARGFVDEFNQRLGVTRAQEEAMKFGSMFGFHTPGADPANYDKDGKLIRTGK